MKKFVVLSLLISCLLCGCNSVRQDESFSDNATDGIFTRIADESVFSLYRENSTDVMYVVYHAGYKGGMTVMLDADGDPLLYSDWKNIN